jgi:glycosyltransferase involved in cell wall biosynthesis
MKLLFVSDNFPPEVNAPATRTHEHCKEWIKQGIDVTIITCAPNFPQGKVYEGYKNKLISRETIDGIKVIRVWSYISSNEGFLKRTIDYISFAIMAFIVGLFVKTDLIVATSPQFFAAISGRWLAFMKRKRWVMEVRDLWPESIKTVGAMNDGLAMSFFEWLELRLYKSASLIVPVTNSFKVNMVERGVQDSKIKVILNGANLDLYKNQPKDLDLEEVLGLKGKFVLGYIGTHGMAHKLDFILDCASRVSDPDVHFLFVGSGAMKKALIDQAEKLELTNVTFLDSVQKELVWRYISILGAMIVPLKKSHLFKTVIPSKIFETAAMNTPILLGVDGEVREIVEAHNAGLFFEPENQKEFLSTVQLIKSDKSLYSDLQAGCARLAKEFDRKKMASKMLIELERLT